MTCPQCGGPGLADGSGVSPGEQARPPRDADLIGVLAQIHAAEYQTLTARSTNWIAIQIALWPVIGGLLALLAEASDKVPHRLLAWGGTIVVLLAMLVYHSASFEQYNNICFIEQVIKPALRVHVGNAPFWNYEPWLQHHRGLSPWWWEYAPLAFPLAALGGAVYLQRTEWSASDTFGLLAALGLLVVEWSLARKCVRARSEMLETTYTSA